MNPSNQNDKIIDTGDVDLPKSWRRSWEVRSLFYILRCWAVLIFLGYLLVTFTSAIIWLEMKWIRFQPLESLAAHAEKAVKDNETQDITKWISLRPLSDRPRIVEILEPYTGALSSGLFIHYSNWSVAAGDVDKGLFWWQLARYRLRYDGLRCGGPTSTDDITALLKMIPQRSIQALLDRDPEALPRSLQQVLDYDAKHPAANDPTFLCTELDASKNTHTQMVPRESWAEIRHTLRIVTEAALQGMQQSKPVR